jgi:subtilisin family serine protease
MKRLLLLLLLGLSIPAASAGASPYADQLLVKYRSGVPEAERAEIRSSVSGVLLQDYSLAPRLELVEVSGPRPEALAALRSDPGVSSAAANAVRTAQETIPDDPFFSDLWGLRNTGQTVVVSSTPYTGTAGSDIRALEAWDITRGSPTSTVAVIDTGIQLNHPDLAGNLWTNPGEIAGNGIDDDSNGFVDDIHGWDFINNDADPNDDAGHGTHVAGTIGAVGDNALGVTGVSWETALMALKACDAANRCPVAATIAALDYAVANGAEISNNSYGGCCGQISVERQAIEAAEVAGHLFVASAGNENDNNDDPAVANYPSSYPLDNIVAVAASGMSDGKASFSSYGLETVDLAAPGTQILSTYLGSAYAWASGTSMSAPAVAGTAALIRSRRPDWQYPEIADQIIYESRPAGAWSGLTATGAILDARAALLFAPAEPTITAQPPITTPDTGAELAFIGEPLADFQCRLDAGSWTPCTSPVEYSDLASGPHTFELRQENPPGYPSEPATVQWSVGEPPEPPEITSGPEAFVRVQTASFAWTGLPGAQYQCRLDGLLWESCTTPLLLQDLGDGPHTLEIRQTVLDLTSDPTQWSWDVDASSPPAPEISSGPGAWSKAQTVAWRFSIAPGADAYCRVDGQAWSTCSSPYSITNPTSGQHLFEVKQIYPEGPSSGISTWAWRSDRLLPKIELARGRKVSGGFRVDLKANDPGGSGLAKIGILRSKTRPSGNQKPAKVFSYSKTKKISGTKPHWVKVRDRAGNWSSWVRIRY